MDVSYENKLLEGSHNTHPKIVVAKELKKSGLRSLTLIAEQNLIFKWYRESESTFIIFVKLPVRIFEDFITLVEWAVHNKIILSQ